MSAPEHVAEHSYRVPADHPAFPGHFPGQPILPGVVLLDEALQAAAARVPQALGWSVPQAKFLRPVQPGQSLLLRLRPLAGAGFAFEFLHDGTVVAQGQLRPTLPAEAAAPSR